MLETRDRVVPEEKSQMICEKEAAAEKTMVDTEEWLGIKPLNWGLDLAKRGVSSTGTGLCAAPRKKPFPPDLAYAPSLPYLMRNVW